MADFNDILTKIKGIENVLDDAKRIIGIEAVNYFTESFDKQSFNGKKWKDVKRRDSSSVWYGFEYGAKTPPPSSHPKRKNAKGKYIPRKTNPTTNYSPNATKKKILSSKKSELENSIQYKITGNIVKVFSDKKYAKVHNEGKTISVFGKKTVKLPKRQFIGKSKELEEIIIKKINKKLKKYL